MKIKNKILCLLLLLLLLMISLLVFVNKKESINALVLYRSSIDELAPLSSDITENTNIKINYKYIFDDTKSNFSTSNLWKDIELFLADESNLRDIDVLFDIPYEYLSYLIKDNKLVDLTNKIDKSTLDNTYYPIIDISKKAGGGNKYFLSPTYSKQFIAIDKEFMQLNNSLFVTWNDIYERVEEEEEGSSIISYGPGGIMGISTDLEILLMSMSPDFIENGDIYGDKELVGELKKLISLYKNYGYKKNYSEELEGISNLNRNERALLKVIYPPQLEDLSIEKNAYYNILPLPVFEGFEDIVNIRLGMSYSVLESSKKQEASLKILSYIMSKEFSEKIISQELYFPNGEFASYIDDDIKELYNQRYNLSNTDFIYAGNSGALNKNQFTQNEYRAFHTVNGEILPLIIDNKINIDDGIEEIKSEFKKVVKILETENKN